MAYKIYDEIPEENAQESFLGKSIRNAAGIAANTVSSVANIAKLPDYLYQHAEQTRNKALQNALEQGGDYLHGDDPEAVRKQLQEYRANPSDPIISKGINKVSQGVESLLPEGYLHPKTENEEQVQDIGAAALFHLGTGGTASNLLPFLGYREAGKAAGQVAKENGAGEIGRLIAEIGVPAVLQSLNIRKIKDRFEPEMKELRDRAERAAWGKKISANELQNNIEKFRKYEHYGTSKTSSIDRQNLLSFKRSFSDDNKLYADEIDKMSNRLKTINKQAGHPEFFHELQRDLDKVINRTKIEIPEFGVPYMQANKLHSVLSKFDQTEGFINRLKESHGLKGIAFETLFGNPVVKGASAYLGLATKFPKKTADHVLKTLEYAARQQAPAFLKELKTLEKLVKPQDKYKIYDA